MIAKDVKENTYMLSLSLVFWNDREKNVRGVATTPLVRPGLITFKIRGQVEVTSSACHDALKLGCKLRSGAGGKWKGETAILGPFYQNLLRFKKVCQVTYAISANLKGHKAIFKHWLKLLHASKQTLSWSI